MKLIDIAETFTTLLLLLPASMSNTDKEVDVEIPPREQLVNGF